MEAHLQGQPTLGEEQPAPGRCPVRIIFFFLASFALSFTGCTLIEVLNSALMLPERTTKSSSTIARECITDKALFGYNSLDSLLEQKIPLGQDELLLRFNDDALDRFVFRR
jgi:hypothetical protein